MASPLYSRRHLLQAATALGVSVGLGGCGAGSGTAQIQFLNRSLPPQLIGQFQRQFAPAWDFKAIANLQELFSNLESWQGEKETKAGLLGNFQPSAPQGPAPPLVSSGDVWLTKAIQARLLQPFAREQLTQWQNLPPRWQLLGQRNNQGLPDGQGEIWAVPYRWGATMVVYRRDAFGPLGWVPQDWSDLWRPELEQRIALVDNAREVIGLTLKKLGYSYNLTNPSAVTNLAPTLAALGKQVKFYSDRHYLQALLNRDVWLAVGWSNEIIPLLRSQPDLTAIVPQSGSSLWADLWTRPARAQADETVYQWLNFSAQAGALRQMALFSNGLAVPYGNSTELSSNPLLQQSPALWERCEFLAPMTPAAMVEYAQLWTTMRSV